MKNAFLLLLLAACGTAPADQAATTAATADTAAALVTTTTTAATSRSPAAAPAPRYDVRGIFDPGLGGIVAYALKVPHGWQVQQAFNRRWTKAFPMNEVYIGLISPDGHQQFDGLPQLSYSYDFDPQHQQMQRAMEQQGAPHDPSNLPPMLPVPYLKQVLLPLLAKYGLHPRLTVEQQAPPKQVPQAPNIQLATGYVEGVLPSGRKVRIQTQLTVINSPQGIKYITWLADTILIQTDGDLAAAVAQQAAIQQSLAVNPTWAKQDEQLKNRGMELNNEQGRIALQQLKAQQQANNEQFQRRMADQHKQFDQHNAAWAAQQHANDQSSAAFRDYLGGQTLYQNAETGQRTRVESGYNHVYQDGQGNTLSTNAPLDGHHVNWQELQQVELKNY